MINSERDYGQEIPDWRLRMVLQKLNPDIKFDPGGTHDIWHPNIERWQGVYLNGHHLASMDRGNIPEYHVYERDTKTNRIVRVMHIGWRYTLERIVRKGVPGITWDVLCRELGVDYKFFRGHHSELETG